MAALDPAAVPQTSGRSARKRDAILGAATEVFLRSGYLGTNMDEIAALSGVSKQTVYKHFGGKEALFVAIVSSVTDEAGDLVRNEAADLDADGDVAAYLADYAVRQLTAVLTPRIMQLRRLVIAEVGRFPDLARVLHERGPQRAVTALGDVFQRLAARGLLRLDDPLVAASQFNWLVMGEPLNRAMLLGDTAIPSPVALRRHAEEAVRAFLAAYGSSPDPSRTRSAVPARR